MALDPTFVDFETPAEYDIQAQRIARQRAIAEAMTAQSMRPQGVQMMGRVAVAPNITEGLARVAQAYAGRKATDRADQQSLEIARGRAGLVNNQIGAMVDNDPSMTPEQKEQFKAAYKTGNPAAIKMVQDAYAARAKAAADGVIRPKDVVQFADPAAIPSMVSEGMAGFKPKVQTIDVAGAPMQQTTGADGKPLLVPLQGYPQLTTETVNGDLYQVDPRTGKRTKLDNAPKVTVGTTINNSIGKGENKFMEGMGEGAAKEVNAARGLKQTAEKTIAVINNLERLDKAGTFSGPTANLATSLNAFADTFGIPVDKAKLGRSQEYTGVLAQQIAGYLTAGAGVGRSLTDADRQAIERQFAQLIVTPEGRARIFNSMRNAANKDIQYAGQVRENLVKNFPDAAALFDVAPSNLEYNTAPVSAEPETAKPTVIRQWKN